MLSHRNKKILKKIIYDQPEEIVTINNYN